MANVALRNVHKTYPGGVEAIKGINFEVGDGQFCVLVGPSGCGKSTLLRMVAGLETNTGGDIDVDAFDRLEPVGIGFADAAEGYVSHAVFRNRANGE